MALRPQIRPGVYTAMEYKAITPSDSVNFTNGICTSIWVGGAGIVQAVDWNGNVVAFTAVAGSVIPIYAIRVNSTSTTASLLVALY